MGPSLRRFRRDIEYYSFRVHALLLSHRYWPAERLFKRATKRQGPGGRHRRISDLYREVERRAQADTALLLRGPASLPENGSELRREDINFGVRAVQDDDFADRSGPKDPEECFSLFGSDVTWRDLLPQGVSDRARFPELGACPRQFVIRCGLLQSRTVRRRKPQEVTEDGACDDGQAISSPTSALDVASIVARWSLLAARALHDV